MHVTATTSLRELRSQLSPDQRAVINAIHSQFETDCAEGRLAREYVGSGPFVQKKRLHRAFTKSLVVECILGLGGSIIVDHPRGGSDGDRYELTCLGLMLTDEGDNCVSMLIKYLRLAIERYENDPDARELRSAEVQNALALDELALARLGSLVRLPGLPWRAGGTYSATGWANAIPDGVDDLAEVEDLALHVEARLVALYDSACPSDSHQQLQYLHRRHSLEMPRGLDFIADTALRERAQHDLNEAHAVYAVRAWKSCIILCGGILECVLLDLVTRRRVDSVALTDQKSALPSDPRKWGLADLLRAAKALNVLRKSTGHLSEAVREYRNLIHPAQHLAQFVPLAQRDARLALDSLAAVIDDVRNSAYGTPRDQE